MASTKTTTTAAAPHLGDRVVVFVGELLLELGHGKELPRVDQARQLADQRHVLGHVAGNLAKLGELVDEALDVVDRLDRLVRLGLLLVRVDQLLDVDAEVAKVDERVLLRGFFVVVSQAESTWLDVRALHTL